MREWTMNAERKFVDVAREQILSRRGFLSNSFSGLAGIGLASLLGPDLVLLTSKCLRVVENI